MKKNILFCLILALFTLLLNQIEVSASSYRNRSYNYNFWLESVPSTPGYRLEKVVDITKIEGVYNFGEITDVYVGDNQIYVVDRVGNQIVILDNEFKLITRITLFKDENNLIMMDGEVQMRLTSPEGVFEAENGDLYVTDTGYRSKVDGTARIVVFTPGVDQFGKTFYYVKQIINKPANYIGNTTFIPSKIVVDNAYRIYTIVQGGNEGIIVLNNDGSFSRFFGTNEIRINLMDYFWKKLASEEQLQQMNLTFAPPFNNIDIDGSGFVYATNSDVTTINKVVRFNPSGANVLREEGYIPPIGDIGATRAETSSTFVSISTNDYGMYLVLDSATGHVFLYNFDGELLFILGSLGSAKGQFKLPGDVSWFNDKILVSDKDTNFISVFTPTEFGELVIDATKDYFVGNWDQAGSNWMKAIELNSNYEMAYVGYGKLLYMNDEYDDAIDYFKLGNNRAYYSMAYKKYRAEYMQDHFGLFILPLVAVVGLVVYSEYRYNKKGGK